MLACLDGRGAVLWTQALAACPSPMLLDPSRRLQALPLAFRDGVLVHIDLHETTDTDETEFRPALAARDGVAHVPGEIPDGFYLVDDSENPQLEFQQAVLAAVAKVTHIAPADRHGEIIGSPMVAAGVINYPLKQLGLCASITQAPYKTTTEVYPDSPRVTAAQCNSAQVAAVCGAIDFALEQPTMLQPQRLCRTATPYEPDSTAGSGE